MIPNAQTAPTLTLEAPVLGVNKKDPLSKMDQRYAAHALNWEPESQYVKVRNGWHIHETISTADNIMALGAYNNSELYAYCNMTTGNHQIFDVTTTTASSVETTDEAASSECYSVKFNKRLCFITDASTGLNWDLANRYYNGSAWTDWGFTEGGSNIGGKIVVQYKGRVYIFADTKVYYSSLAGVTGATTEIDFAENFEEAGEIRWANVITSPSGRNEETMLCFGNSAGEVLVYTGDYEAAANWELVGQFKIAPPLFRNACLRYKNDVWVCTTVGVVSIRKLYTSGSEAPEDYTVSAKIDPYWKDLIGNTGILNNRCSIAYWPEKNQVYILMVGHVSKDGTYASDDATLFVHNGFTGAWMIQRFEDISTPLGSITYMNNAMYWFTGNHVLKLNESSYKDEVIASPGTYVEYAVELDSASFNFGSDKRFKRLHSLHPNIKTDFSGSKIGMRASADFGRKTTATSNQTLVDGYNNHPYNVGIEGNYLQYQFIGTSDSSSTDGFEFYAIGASLS